TGDHGDRQAGASCPRGQEGEGVMGKPETTLKRMLIVSKEAGYIVAGVKTDGDKIELIFETPKDALPADLIDWSRKK
ncbi:hypothetical protein, partial [Paracoccus simplex]